ncbi:hypothetical protein [Halobacteriovorax sp. JY17]|uniref:hypothetical protein n=1 Tax=Halobacteriovorax sp. JY17 TaxID=2014617 RepID=UPI0025C0FFC5|nr:hypothetical protein [Halobacteriovorax sp. JY17]
MFKSNLLHYILGYSLSFLLGCTLCNFLFIYFDLNMVLSSSLVGLVGSLAFFKNKEAQAAIFCGSFAGMSDPNLFYDWTELLVISFAGGLILFFLRKKLIGLGGKLGAVAFSSLLSLLLFRGVFK